METVAAELETYGLFRQVGLWETEPVPFRQSVDAWIEAIHARNGFSRDRMALTDAAEFDQQVRALLSRHCPNGEVVQQIQVRIIYGNPLDPAYD
ncbi:MAG: hypothetical protein R2932_41805 [Caldilineaceae bacterium]